MSRLTLRLPETLHRQLAAQAKCEGVSVNQYVGYALSPQLTQSDTVHAVPEEKVEGGPATGPVHRVAAGVRPGIP